MTQDSSAPAGNAAFEVAFRRTTALSKLTALCATVELNLRQAGYSGTVCIAGGYVRDVALGKTPKDLDVFIDGGALRETGVSAKDLVENLAGLFPTGAHLDRIIPCYGGWATDIDLVAKLDVLNSEGRTFNPDGLPVPTSVDLIVMRREALVAQDYIVGDPASFLKKVIERVDLRLNAIGVTPHGSDFSVAWDYDALYSRLVIQYARRDDPQERIDKRVDRLTSPDGGKFAGWTPLYEGPDGQLSRVLGE